MLSVRGGTGFANALRRALCSDIESWAPCHVDVRSNTSCQHDEYIAHRIGLVPFRRIVKDGPDEMRVDRTGPCTVTAADLVGPSFDPVHPGIEVIVLGKDQRLDATVTFDRKPASKHARYARCAAVGMRHNHADGTHDILFEPLDPKEPPHEAMHDALDAIERRVDDALRQLADQPSVPPKSMC